MSALWDAMKPIRLTNGMVPAADGGDDNLILHTATFLSLLEPNSDEAQSVWLDCEEYCLKTQIVPGVFSRKNPAKGPNSLDNLIGVCFSSRASGTRAYMHGSAHGWYYGTSGYPRIGDWYGRFIGFPSIMRCCFGSGLRFLDSARLRLAFWFVTLSPHDETSDKCLAVLQVRMLTSRLGKDHVIVKGWKRRMMAKYPGGLSELYGIYYGHEHPFCLNAPKDFNL